MIGWGTFELPMTLVFHPILKKEPITISHELCFTGEGKHEEFELSLSKTLLCKLPVKKRPRTAIEAKATIWK